MAYATLLVNLEAGRSNRHLLEAAADVAERFGAGVTGVAACQPMQMVYGDGYAFADMLERDRQEIAREVEAAEAEFHAVLGSRVRVLDWRPTLLVPSLSEHVASEACCADLILMGAVSAKTFNPTRQTHPGDLVMQAGRPVLVVTPAPLRLDRVLLAWKDTRETRRAAADALPLLRKASHVCVAEMADEADLADARRRLADVAGWLGRHGVTAECLGTASTGDDPKRLNAIAEEQAADLIVAGAYGHSRLREWALGGVTRTLLGQAGRAAFVSH